MNKYLAHHSSSSLELKVGEDLLRSSLLSEQARAELEADHAMSVARLELEAENQTLLAKAVAEADSITFPNGETLHRC